ncbi:hypothetical protein [Paenibacillus massiliensis]|uniref:hypothetical protein n=1 Tax=Paenibacillus massiliensis TaxID=225917 RepID=UPI0004025424|nr:hypothetical protein [Paenibacillus massiliensis]
MRLVSVLGILFLAAVILFGEWHGCSTRRVRVIMISVTLGTAILAIVLLYQPNLPGPTQWIKLLFGKIDKIMK